MTNLEELHNYFTNNEHEHEHEHDYSNIMFLQNHHGLCPCTATTATTATTTTQEQELYQTFDKNHNNNLLETLYEPYQQEYYENEQRMLLNEDNNDKGGGKTWQIIYTSFVLLFMFLALISDRVGADMVMIIALALLMASEIITVTEGIEGFANEGLLTVLILFVVASGISHTGALDWYMGKLLGRPETTASAQLRLMIPIAIISAFLNNTPVVAVMIPIVQRWGKNVGVSPQLLLVPLSFASILGGTCTLIGTSTNLVVVGLLQTRYPNNKDMDVGLFDLGQYGVPVALVGMTYILILSPYLLPGGPKFIGNKGGGNSGGGDGNNNTNGGGAVPTDLDDSILLGARLTQWSGAAGRSVKRSGLRDTGGLYLVSVHRNATGNVHRAVGQEFVLNVGDVLYFTGLVEGFGEFCEENGLEVVTNEVEDSTTPIKKVGHIQQEVEEEGKEEEFQEERTSLLENSLGNSIIQGPSGDGESLGSGSLPTKLSEFSTTNTGLAAIPEFTEEEVGTTKESIVRADEAERWRSINRIQDVIRGLAIDDQEQSFKAITPKNLRNAPAKIVVVSDKHGTTPLVVVAVNARDRPGLLTDISKSMIQLKLNFHHTEAIVSNERSLSLWRCEVLEGGVSNIEEIWSVLSAMLENESGIEALKHRGLRVIRAVVTKQSTLIRLTAVEANFREKYQAAIIAVQRGGKSITEKLSQVKFASGDILILQASDNSPLLIRPPDDFYKKQKRRPRSPSPSHHSKGSLSRFVKKRLGSFGSHSDVQSLASEKSDESPAKVLRDGSEKKSENKLDSVTNNGDIESQTQGDSVQSNGEGGDFFIEGELNENSTNNATSPQKDPVIVIDTERIQNEEIWKDLSVVFSYKKSEETEISREFLTAMEISHNSSLATKSVVEIGLDKLPGVFLVSIERPLKQDRKSIVQAPSVEEIAEGKEAEIEQEPATLPLSPDDILQEGDVLWFSGSANAIGDLRKIPGLKSFVNEEVKKINEKVHDRRLVQAVIARKGPLVGKTVRDARFRTRYGAAVISVHREGKRVQEHPGKIILQAGDVLLLEAGPTFIKQHAEGDKSFALLSEVEDSAPPRLALLIPALLITVAMLAVYTIGVTSLLICGLIASILMVCLGILTQQEARDAINWEIYITIAAAFGIGTALTNSGVAKGVADGLVALGKAINIGDAGLYGAVYFATFLISNVVTNNAAAALLFPIAMDAAEQTGADRKLMSYTLMLGASASFMSPFGYTTNLLIYGPGGYKYADFLRIGTLMQVILWIVSVAIVSFSDGWYWSWIITFVLFITVSVGMTFGISVLSICKKNQSGHKESGTHDDEEDII